MTRTVAPLKLSALSILWDFLTGASCSRVTNYLTSTRGEEQLGARRRRRCPRASVLRRARSNPRLCRLTRTTQPGLVSPGGSEQAQRYHPASLLSESAESLRHLDANHRLYREYGDAESVRGRCLDPRYGKFLIGSLYLSLSDQEKFKGINPSPHPWLNQSPHQASAPRCTTQRIYVAGTLIELSGSEARIVRRETELRDVHMYLKILGPDPPKTQGLKPFGNE